VRKAKATVYGRLTAAIEEFRRFGGLKSLRDPRGIAWVRRVVSHKLTYIGPAALLELRAAVRAAERAGRRGVLVECGCALGGSAIVMATARAPKSRRPLYVYDVFGLIPPPGDNDGQDVVRRYEEIVSGHSVGLGGDTYYGYKTDLIDEVAGAFERFGLSPSSADVHLVAGLFEDTVRPEWPVAVAHIDGDWYDSVMVCLERLWPVLEPGGVIVIDDYFDWSGCRRAVDEFVAEQRDCRTVLRSKLHLVKQMGRTVASWSGATAD
jgi:Macrocin-O-methyltransferase (TylF)